MSSFVITADIFEIDLSVQKIIDMNKLFQSITFFLISAKHDSSNIFKFLAPSNVRTIQ